MPTTFQDYYATLGVPKAATQDEIKRAFRKLARENHPDATANDPVREERFKQVNEAYEVLKDPEKRAKYDKLGANWQAYEQWERAGRPGQDPLADLERAGGGSHTYTVSPDEFAEMFGGGGFSSFFDQFFGGGGGSPRFRTAGARRAVATQGADVEGEVTISLEEAFTGTARTVEMQEGGSSRRVEVRIPPGINDGARVRAAGQGGRGSGGGKGGDLFVRVHVGEDARFRRTGKDLRTTVDVPLRTALLGGQVAVPTLKGTTVALTIPADTQNGAVMRLRGLGMPDVRSGPAGDLLAEVRVRLPVPLTEAQRKAAEAFGPEGR